MLRARLFTGLIAALLCCGLAQAELPIERFVDKPELVAPRLSPNGRYLATPVRSGSRMAVAVHDLDAPRGTRPRVILTEDLEIEWVEWANDDRLLIAFVVMVDLKYPAYTGSRIARAAFKQQIRRVVACDRDGSNLIGLMTPDRRFRANRDLTLVAHMLPESREHVLMAANDRRSHFNLYRVNVYTGQLDEVAEGRVETDSWLTDLRGVPRVRWDYDSDDEKFEMFVRSGDGDVWEKVSEYGEKDLPDLKVVGFADDPKVAIVANRQSTDRLALYEYDLVGRKLGRRLFGHDTVDVGSPFGSLLYDPATSKLIGATYVEDLWRVHYFDDELRLVQAAADEAFPDSAIVRLVSWPADRRRFVFYTEGPKDPGSYHLLDRRSKTSELIGRSFPKLVPKELGDVAIIRYPTRDGIKLTGYLTLPPGRGEKNLPMVVLPHGGPELRDAVEFDPLAQALANRGYLVFQPNFRGSGGYGRAFAEAGHRQWGRRMQDDITDGVEALIADGSVDRNRICIVGGSYGGYAALAGGAFTPELYKCVVSFAGVSDLVGMVEYERRSGVESSVYRYWAKRMGDPRTDEEEMRAWSPVRSAAKFKAPVLLIHGEWDGNVPYKQSLAMEGALSAAGKDVQLIRVRQEGHGFDNEGSQLLLFSEIERFVVRHLGR